MALDFGPSLPRREARRRLASAFAAAAIESADLDARVLLCAALGIDHAGLTRDPDQPLGESAPRVQSFALRRLSREPVSRILGYREFWSARFALDSSVLDPRPDTETLIEAVLDHVGGETRRQWRILELGIGSGAILCALLQSLPNAFGVGVDLSAAACAIAGKNLNALGLSARGFVVCGDWTEPFCGEFDFIVGNPPYIVREAIAALAPEVRDFDPHLALDGGEDGVAIYRRIIPASCPLLVPGGVMALEHGRGQREAVEEFLHAAGLAPFSVRLDLAGRERIILAQRLGGEA